MTCKVNITSSIWIRIRNSIVLSRDERDLGGDYKWKDFSLAGTFVPGPSEWNETKVFRRGTRLCCRNYSVFFCHYDARGSELDSLFHVPNEALTLFLSSKKALICKLTSTKARFRVNDGLVSMSHAITLRVFGKLLFFQLTVKIRIHWREKHRVDDLLVLLPEL